MASKLIKPKRASDPAMGLKKPKGEIIANVSKGRQYENGAHAAPKRGK